MGIRPRRTLPVGATVLDVRTKGAPMDLHVRIGDHIVVDARQLGSPPRKGTIIEVLGAGERCHYRVRWADGAETVFFPASTTHAIQPSEMPADA